MLSWLHNVHCNILKVKFMALKRPCRWVKFVENIELCMLYVYPWDKRPEFKMWEELPKSVFVLVVSNLSTTI